VSCTPGLRTLPRLINSHHLWNDHFWCEATTGVDAGGRRLELNLFSHIQGVVHLNPEIPDGAFQFGMTE
jgi:hypothetical protein